MVWMGSFTQSFIPAISASNAVILGPIDAKRDVHVRNAPPASAPTPVRREVADAR
jgi:hypothetical protein